MTRSSVGILGGAALAAMALTLAPATALACGEGSQTAAKMSIKKVTVAQLSSMITDAKKNPAQMAVLDVNSAKTRAKMGTIPGARLLTSASHYAVAKELPADREAQLVFYCANTMCSASKEAAKRAVEAGYRNVAILPAGIEGWVEAGQRVENHQT